jgi:hypothetical protein
MQGCVGYMIQALRRIDNTTARRILISSNATLTLATKRQPRYLLDVSSNTSIWITLVWQSPCE